MINEKSTADRTYYPTSDPALARLRKFMRDESARIGGFIAEGVAKGELPREKGIRTLQRIGIRIAPKEEKRTT